MHNGKVNVKLLKVYGTKTTILQYILKGGVSQWGWWSGGWGRSLKELGVESIKTCLKPAQGRTGRRGGAGLGNKLLCIGGAAEHLPNGLGDGVAVDAVDLEQLVRFATAGDVGNGQTLQVESGLVDHG